jgi:hypothetical protein
MTVGHNGINNIRDGKAEWVPPGQARHVADSINDDALDVLYERLAVTQIALDRIGEWANGDVVTARNEFGNGYREAMRDIRDLLPDPAQRPAASTTKETA